MRKVTTLGLYRTMGVLGLYWSERNAIKFGIRPCLIPSIKYMYTLGYIMVSRVYEKPSRKLDRLRREEREAIFN